MRRTELDSQNTSRRAVRPVKDIISGLLRLPTAFSGHFRPFHPKGGEGRCPDKDLTAEGLLSFARQCLDIPTVYIWGTLGEKATASLIDRCRRDYPEKFDDMKLHGLKPFCRKGYRGFDCSGLLKRYVMGGLDHYHYSREKDLNSASLFAASQRKGPIDTLPEIPGICLFMEGHTGVYEGGGSVIESTSNPRFGNGVVRTKLSDRPWTHWYEMPWVKY